jgi:hypothetical protein
MTNNPTDTKQTNTNGTARSTSDPSDSQPVHSPSQNTPQKTKNKHSSSSTPPPLQPDPQHSDSSASTSTSSSSNSSTSSSTSTSSNSDPSSSASQPPQGSPSAPQQSQQTDPGSSPSSPYGSFADWGFDDPFDDLDNNADPGFDSFGSGAPGFGGTPRNSPYGGQAEKRMTPEERVQMIELVYNEILQRKPDTRDINYYKYSTLSEEQIRKQLTASAEHTDMIKKGREYEGLKEHAEQMESRVNMLEGQIKDHVEEFRELSNLLQEKNRLIQQLRQKNSQALPHPKAGPIRPEQAAQPLPPDDRGLQPDSPAPSESYLPPQENHHTDLNSITDNTQPELKEPSPEIRPAMTAPQTASPQHRPVFTSQSGAPPPPDIPTESGIITAEQNSLARRLKRAIKNILRSFF